jgi:hypothetical protein
VIGLVLHAARYERQELPAIGGLGHLHVLPAAEPVHAGGEEHDDVAQVGVAAEGGDQ